MALREPSPDDGERIRELVDSSLTTSYALSPQQIEAVVEDQFGQDRIEVVADADDAVALVAESDDEVERETIVGVALGELAGGRGELRWVFVDPEHRGKGIGTELFETATDELRDRGADDVRVYPLEESTEGPQFAERLGFEHVDERDVEIGEESFVEYVYAEESADGTEEAERAPTDPGDLPGVETGDGRTTATTDDGRTVYVDADEEVSGTSASFFAAYEDESLDEQFGFYCGNCGSTDVSVDQMDRLECGNCGNSHASRSEEAYDDSFL